MTEVWVIGEERKKERKERRKAGWKGERKRERKREEERGRERKDGWEEIFSVGMEGSPDVFRIFAMIWHMMD